MYVLFSSFNIAISEEICYRFTHRLTNNIPTFVMEYRLNIISPEAFSGSTCFKASKISSQETDIVSISLFPSDISLDSGISWDRFIYLCALNLIWNSFIIICENPSWSSYQLSCFIFIFQIVSWCFHIVAIIWKYLLFLSFSWNHVYLAH